MTRDDLPVPACTGRAFRVKSGERFQVIDVEGRQVGDLAAVAARDPDEHVFLPVTRLALGRIEFRGGDVLLTNRRAPLLRLDEDIAGTDVLFGVCDRYRYEVDFGIPGYHRNCRDNLIEALAEFGLDEQQAGACSDNGVNIFINQRRDDDGVFHLEAPLTKPGDAATFTALMDAIVALSACPESQSDCNGRRPTPMAIRFLESSAGSP